jgi:hypothetical protein
LSRHPNYRNFSYFHPPPLPLPPSHTVLMRGLKVRKRVSLKILGRGRNSSLYLCREKFGHVIFHL